MQLELLSSGHGLVEGPRTDADDNLYFTDIPNGAVYRRRPDGTLDTLVQGRTMVGGLALHADGGFVMSGPTIAHWRDGEVRVLLQVDGVPSFNDIHPAGGRRPSTRSRCRRRPSRAARSAVRIRPTCTS